MTASDYTIGTVSIANGSTTLQGAGTTWLSADFREGDVLYLKGFAVPIASVDAEDTITLTAAWPGATLADEPYRLRYEPDLARTAAKTQALIDGLENLKGETGDPGTNFAPDAQGFFVERSTYDDEVQWFSFLSIDGDAGATTSDPAIFFKLSAVSGDWSDPVAFVGPAGADGADGAAMLSGNGGPDPGLGQDGDTYLDRQTGDLYQKAAGAWALTGSSLTGPQGDPGADGFSMLTGDGPPDAGLGQDGDAYLDRLTGETYEKIAGVWTATGASLKGPKGDDGDAGAAGADGDDGADGAPGLSAYEIWLNDGNVGTEAEFLASLEGEPGPPLDLETLATALTDDPAALDILQSALGGGAPANAVLHNGEVVTHNGEPVTHTP